MVSFSVYPKRSAPWPFCPDRTAKGLIPDAEAGKDVMQNARQARACKLVHADVTAAPRRQNGSPICPICLSEHPDLLAPPFHDRRASGVTTDQQYSRKEHRR
uniref:Uncharacterized protein n=1 Tax=Rhizobium rhizogenes TaxID=359 RepID=A0A2Z2PQA0_RHIRH|nr:hypothetical protein [Rhizobium rhizogenes]